LSNVGAELLLSQLTLTRQQAALALFTLAYQRLQVSRLLQLYPNKQPPQRDRRFTRASHN
jgi:hypothetical protein